MLFGFRSNRTRLLALEDKVHELERAFNALELEWTDVYDKVRSILGKIAKRESRALEESQQSDLTSADGAPALSLDPRSAQIRALRRAPR